MNLWNLDDQEPHRAPRWIGEILGLLGLAGVLASCWQVARVLIAAFLGRSF